jgi:chorismate dehydratase
MQLSLQAMTDENKQLPFAPINKNEKIRVGAVSYLNTKPLIYGFEKGMMQQQIELLIDHPGNIANALLDGTIDIGLIPVAIIPQMKSPFIASDYCIAADGEVGTVCLFSEVPLQQIETVLLDYQSRTSVLLVQYLFKFYWKLQPAFVDATTDFIEHICGTTAAVVIGDRAFVQRNVSAYCFDLSLAWKNHTGLPFVFATWVSNKPLSNQFVQAFNRANQAGLLQIDEVVKENSCTIFDLKKYYTQYIQYTLDDKKREGLQLFLNWCSNSLSATVNQMN